MNREQDQSLNLRELFWPAIALVFTMAFAVAPSASLSGDLQTVKIRTKAEVLAHQVAQLYRESLAQKITTSGRAPAAIEANGDGAQAQTEGLVGSDAWGNAYRYRISPMDHDRLRIEMRSPGPNGVFEAAGSSDDIDLVLTL